ncbi:MAG: metal ABC transporter permease, partial [Rhodospirillales bacterium]|nr:metal ABC transporter permease [Rhodospirillales bacterium]
MTPPDRTHAGRKTEPSFEWGALRALGPYIWPRGQLDIKFRVVIALALLALAKIANVFIPYLYKLAVEILGGEAGMTVALPLGLLIGYGILRVLSIAFAELRDAVFAKVGQRAIRRVALQTFRHLHALALRFHLERQTGGLSRLVERGT